MTSLLIYDHRQNGFICLNEDDSPLPFLRYANVRLRSFVRSARTNLAWTDRRLLEAYDACCHIWGAPIPAHLAFRRLESGLRAPHSPHYAGLSIIMGGGMDKSDLSELHSICLKMKDFDRIAPPYIAPSWIEAALNISTSQISGYPSLNKGMRGVHVLLLQDALRLCGYVGDGVTGTFSEQTEFNVKRFNLDHGCGSGAIASQATWKLLMREAMRQIALADKAMR